MNPKDLFTIAGTLKYATRSQAACWRIFFERGFVTYECPCVLSMARLGTILLVDDSPNDVDLLLRTFQQLAVPNPIEVCRGGQEAIDYLSDSQRAKPALILLDLKMPATDGFAVLKWIKSHPQLKELVVVVLTTSDSIHDIRRAYMIGANSFLTKPVNLDDFKNLISAFHHYWMVSNQLLTADAAPNPVLPLNPSSPDQAPVVN
jgi:CheY-like chemotaxis protein